MLSIKLVGLFTVLVCAYSAVAPQDDYLDYDYDAYEDYAPSREEWDSKQFADLAPKDADLEDDEALRDRRRTMLLSLFDVTDEQEKIVVSETVFKKVISYLKIV